MFSVRARNALGYGAYSSSVTLMAASVPGKPVAPTIRSASSASISIQWTTPSSGGSSITNFYVYVAVGSAVSESDY